LSSYRIALEKLLRFKPHTLGEAEERLLALQAETKKTAQAAFSALNDVDLDFGTIETKEGKMVLTHGSYAEFLLDSDQEVRRRACEQFMLQYRRHENTIAALYAGSIHLDIYESRIRKFGSSIEAKLFSDKVPLSVYTNLIETVTKNLGVLHRYYEVMRKTLKVDRLFLYDTKVPLVADTKMQHSFEEATNLVLASLSPLGKEYTQTLEEGLKTGWVDKYESKGKRSGAFSAGSFTGDPYILMNYKSNVLRDTFTLAHEAGHSMHSFYSARENPFQHYNYTVFEAEVASTFNEQLLLHYLLENSTSEQTKIYLINKQIDDLVGTFFRQTMFAEYEMRCHALAECGKSLTVSVLKREYKNLLLKYFGDDIGLLENDDLEGIRIPHFYRAFYVYKYATGIAAAISLSEAVLKGKGGERERYFSFLKSGGSCYPIESLKKAGIDLGTAKPLERTIEIFQKKVEELASYFSV
jgi:oligoendopeptidase F